MKYKDLLRKEEILSCVDLGWVVGCDDLWWRRQQLPEVDGPSKSFLLPQHLSVHVLFFLAQQPLLILTSLDLYKHTLDFLQIIGNRDKYILRFGRRTFSDLNKRILRFGQKTFWDFENTFWDLSQNIWDLSQNILRLSVLVLFFPAEPNLLILTTLDFSVQTEEKTQHSDLNNETFSR